MSARPRHLACALWFKQVFDHVEDEQRPHPVIGEALPHFGCEQIGERPRVTENFGPRAVVVLGNCACCAHNSGRVGIVDGQTITHPTKAFSSIAAPSVRFSQARPGGTVRKQGDAMTRTRSGIICALAVLLAAFSAEMRARNPTFRTARSISSSALRPAAAMILFARLVVQKFQENTGATAVIDNRVGAGGRIAAEFAARQPADGYTVLVGATGQMSIATAIFPDLSYNASTSFIPLNMIASFPSGAGCAGGPSCKNVKELVAWAKANPDKSNYGTSSPAFTIASELLKLKTGMPAVAIPYKSSNESNLERGRRAMSVHHLRRAAGDPAGQGRQNPRAGGHGF